MKKELKPTPVPVHLLVAIVLTYLISKFFFNTFGFSYNFFSDDAFNVIDTFIQFAVYLIVFPMLYGQIAFLFNRQSKHDV